jgi:hypothetical protein
MKKDQQGTGTAENQGPPRRRRDRPPGRLHRVDQGIRDALIRISPLGGRVRRAGRRKTPKRRYVPPRDRCAGLGCERSARGAWRPLLGARNHQRRASREPSRRLLGHALSVRDGVGSVFAPCNRLPRGNHFSCPRTGVRERTCLLRSANSRRKRQAPSAWLAEVEQARWITIPPLARPRSRGAVAHESAEDWISIRAPLKCPSRSARLRAVAIG